MKLCLHIWRVRTKSRRPFSSSYLCCVSDWGEWLKSHDTLHLGLGFGHQTSLRILFMGWTEKWCEGAYYQRELSVFNLCFLVLRLWHLDTTSRCPESRRKNTYEDNHLYPYTMCCTVIILQYSISKMTVDVTICVIKSQSCDHVYDVYHVKKQVSHRHTYAYLALNLSSVIQHVSLTILRWQSWMPNETACSSGKGLVDTFLDLVVWCWRLRDHVIVALSVSFILLHNSIWFYDLFSNHPTLRILC